jgi:hypothetical protein
MSGLSFHHRHKGLSFLEHLHRLLDFRFAPQLASTCFPKYLTAFFSPISF